MKTGIQQMFDSIAPDYDRLNHLLSLDVDRHWRRRAIKKIIDVDTPLRILDVACGTGDFSIEIAKRSSDGTSIDGIDLSEGMLEIMERKVAEAGLESRISIMHGNCEQLPMGDNSYDRVTIAFGVRNFEHRELALRQVLRVLKPGGRLVILELSVPSNKVLRGLYKLYFLNILPWIGGRISGERAAYRYLPASVLKFPGKDEWTDTMKSCGYGNVTHKAFSLGICRMYTGEKSL